MEENKNQDRAQERAAFYCDTGTKLYRTVAEARNEYTYTVTGAKLRVVHRWNPAYSNSPVIGSAVNAGPLTEKITVDYAGNKIYKNGALKKILTGNGYYENGKYYFYIRDHLDNNRIVADQEGNEEQSPQYYPFGMVLEETGREKQAFKFGGKELDMMNGLNLYDFVARPYDPNGWFLTPDPLAEKYPWISTYAYCLNNPVNFFDPNGMDVWEINDYGEIVNRIKDKTQDAFYMVAKDNEGNYQRTFTTDAEGNKNYNSISFEYGTVTSVQEKSLKTDAGEVTLTMFNIKGDDKATQLFEFMSNPGVTTNVEWSHDKIGTEKSEKNVVGTIHLLKNTVQGYYLSKKGYTIREDNHSHPGGTEKTSRADEQVAKYILEKNRKASLNIYIPQKKKYIPYNASGVITK